MRFFLFIGGGIVDHTTNGVPVEGDPGLGLMLGLIVLSLKLVVETVLLAWRDVAEARAARRGYSGETGLA